MSELARQLIAECQRTKATYLDLGRCGLTDLNEIPELFECTQLETLVLSNEWYDSKKRKSQLTQNKGAYNTLNGLPNSFVSFVNLKKLVAGFNVFKNGQISGLNIVKDLANLTALDLSSNEITDIPFLKDFTNLTSLILIASEITDISFLKNLSNLTTLVLSDNKITEISFLKDLGNLTSLDLSDNQITDPSFLKDLRNLTNLNLSRNQITDISFLKNLTNLTNLDLSSNQITDFSFLRNLTNLTELKLRSNQIIDISFLKNLQHLTDLNLSNNPIANFSFLKDLPNLTNLDLRKIQITDILFLKDLSNLTNLVLRENQITNISFLKNLPNLIELDLRNNQITDISSLKDLSNLTNLDLSSNQITKFPQFLLYFNIEIAWKSYAPGTINLYNNPIENVPIEIIQQGKEAIRRYFEEEQGAPLYEAKILILGEGNAGKTTLVEKLLNPDYELTTIPTTHGLEVRPWCFGQHTAHIWDFGGQEIYQATHRFFLTKRSLYVLLTDNRAEDTDFNYWFEKIGLFGEDSPLIIVQNERDNRKKELSATITGASLNNLKNVVQVNFADNRGLPELVQALKTQFCSLPHISQQFPKRWRKVREALEEIGENHISWDRYVAICKANKIPEKEVQSDLCQYLHDLGILLHFSKNTSLKKTVFLNPHWATRAVYDLIDFIGKGKFTEAEAAAVWAAPRNEGTFEDMQTELLALMSNFEICYAQEETFILPQLLTEKAPDYTWEDSDNLQLIYRYGFMPQGILLRLMVRLHRFLTDSDLVWKKGAIFFREDAKAEVTEENSYLKREIRIRVSGKFKKEFLTILLEELENIHRTYNFDKIREENRPQMLVPCNCVECRESNEPEFYEYNDLRRRLTKGKSTVECKISYEPCNVRSLLDDVFITHREVDFLGRLEPGGEEYTILSKNPRGFPKTPVRFNTDQLFDQIDNNEMDAVFETLEKNKAIFKGFQDLRERFIHDNLKGAELQKFKEALKVFIKSKV